MGKIRPVAEIRALKKKLEERGPYMDATTFQVWNTIKWVLNEDEIEGDFLAELGLQEKRT